MCSADVTRVVNSVKLWNKNGGRKFLSITINHIRFKYNMIDECHSGNNNQLCLYSSLSSYHYLSHCSFPSPFFSSCDSVNYSVSVCLSTSVAVNLCFCLSVTICVSHYVYLLLIQSQSCVIHHDSFCFKQRLHHN